VTAKCHGGPRDAQEETAGEAAKGKAKMKPARPDPDAAEGVHFGAGGGQELAPARLPRLPSSTVTEEWWLQVMAVPGIFMNIDLTTQDRRPSQDTARFTPRRANAVGSTGCEGCAGCPAKRSG
jgi:hypothetical protein